MLGSFERSVYGKKGPIRDFQVLNLVMETCERGDIAYERIVLVTLRFVLASARIFRSESSGWSAYAGGIPGE